MVPSYPPLHPIDQQLNKIVANELSVIGPIGLSRMDAKIRELSILIGLLAREIGVFICAQKLCGRNTAGSVNFK